MFKSDLVLCTVFFFFVLLTINKILNPFSLAAEFVRFLVRFSPVGTGSERAARGQDIVN